jgi:hypothetical protein
MAMMGKIPSKYQTYSGPIDVRFEGLTAMAMKVTLFYNVTLYRLACNFKFLSEDEGSKFLLNVGIYLPNYKVSYRRRRYSSANVFH